MVALLPFAHRNHPTLMVRSARRARLEPCPNLTRGHPSRRPLRGLLWMRTSYSSLNRGAVVADQADVLNWLGVNDPPGICHEIGAFGNIDGGGRGFCSLGGTCAGADD